MTQARRHFDGDQSCPDSMPFECGVFHEALRFGRPSQRRKHFLLLDTEPYRCQKPMSDASGLDPRAHDDKPEKLIACVRDFLSAGLDPKPIGPTAMIALYDSFVSALAAIAVESELTLADIEPLSAFNDWYLLAARWLQQQPSSKR
jgi:hypothetical protein